MNNNDHQPNEWLTLKEAEEITGKSAASIRGSILRGQYDRVKKVMGKTRKIWLIHRNEIEHKIDHDRSERTFDQNIRSQIDQAITIPLEYYEQQQKEHDQLMQGMLMYRWKFEELDRKLKLLPAPVEVISNEFEKLRIDLETKEKIILNKEQTLQSTQNQITEIKDKLQNLELERNELENTLQKAQNAQKKTSEERNDLLGQIDQIKATELELQKMKQHLETNLEELQLQLEISKEEINDLNDRIKKLQTENEDIAKEKKLADEKISSLETEKQKAEDDASHLKKKVAELEEQLQQEKAILEDRLNKKDEMQQKIKAELEDERKRPWWKKLFGMK